MIPLSTTTPKSTTSTPAATTPSSSTPTSSGGTGQPQPQPILLDTNAATTYNPYNYPAAGFGDPSLAIDGETSTGWSAQVDPAVAPKMAEGLAIDLKSARKLSAVALVTTTPGMTVQVYGTSDHTLPTSITDPAWVKLSPSIPVKARHMRIKARVNESKVSYVYTGQPVEIRVDAFPDHPLRGTVAEVTAIPAPATGPISDVKVYYAMIRASGRLSPDLVEEARYLVREACRANAQLDQRVGLDKARVRHLFGQHSRVAEGVDRITTVSEHERGDLERASFAAMRGDAPEEEALEQSAARARILTHQVEHHIAVER